MRIYLLILLSLVFLYGQEDVPCVANGVAWVNDGIYSYCEDGTTGCDCNDDCGGSAGVDECGNCSGGNTGKIYDYTKDECEECNGNGLGFGDYYTNCWDGIEYCTEQFCPFNPNDCEDGTTGCDCNDDCAGNAGNDGCYGSYYVDTCVPTIFSLVNQSFYQPFYKILSVTINGEPVNADDWVGAFNNESVCVGAKKWDTAQCNGGICALHLNGYDDTNDITTAATEGYMQAGDIPTFQIYDASENMFHYAEVSENIVWNASAEDITISSLVVVEGCTDEGACNYNPYATEDNDSCLENDCAGVCGGSAVEDESGECSNSMAIDELLILNNYSISSIYPNPFNPITNIEYSLPENASIGLIIYNIHGRHIQTLVQGFQTAGYHSINWNAQNYPSGVYLIRLESGTYSKTQKVVLFK